MHFTQIKCSFITTGDDFIIFCTRELFLINLLLLLYFTNDAVVKNATNNNYNNNNHKMSLVDTRPHFIRRPSWLF